jgi:hypothetical protein
MLFFPLSCILPVYMLTFFLTKCSIQTLRPGGKLKETLFIYVGTVLKFNL